MKNIDAEIVSRLRNDDRKAFDKLYWQYSRKIYLNALRLIKDRGGAEDIVQDVFITLWEKRLSIDPSKPILNWIFVVSHNKSIDYLRKNFPVLPVSEIVLSDFHCFDEEKIHKKERQLELIERAVQKLSPQKRRTFELCKIQGCSYGEAAQRLCISKYTVKEYLSAAMKDIKTFVGTSTQRTSKYY